MNRGPWARPAKLVQKALASGVSILCAVSAPSSLAVELATEFGLKLVGFLRGDRFNVYTGHQRVAAGAPSGQLPG
jgi:FdhD protein